MIDYQQLFHVGIRVHDIRAAMDEMGESLGVTWANLQFNEAQAIWTPEQGLRHVPLHFVYSAEGPQHIELLEGPPDTPWEAGDAPGVHHVGVWVDDVAAESERLIGMGWELLLAGAAPEDGYGSMTYLQPPNGTLVELVTSAARPRFDAWWAGGNLGYDIVP